MIRDARAGKLTWTMTGLSPESEHFKKVVSTTLIAALAQVCELRPADPIEFIAQYLLNSEKPIGGDEPTTSLSSSQSNNHGSASSKDQDLFDTPGFSSVGLEQDEHEEGYEDDYSDSNSIIHTESYVSHNLEVHKDFLNNFDDIFDEADLK